MDTNKEEAFYVQIPLRLKPKLEAEAKKKDMSLSNLVTRKLEQPEYSYEEVVKSNLNVNLFINIIRGLPLKEKDQNMIISEVAKYVKIYTE